MGGATGVEEPHRRELRHAPPNRLPAPGDMMLSSATFETRYGHVLIAGCDSEAEALAAMRWIWPVVDAPDAPPPMLVVCDTRDCAAARAAPVNDPHLPPRWDQFDTAVFDHAEPVCHVLGGRFGLILLADADRTDRAARALAGISACLVCIRPGDPLMAPVNRTFAAFGLMAEA
jgi:hypothetical protein